jgi:hypothetical protein
VAALASIGDETTGEDPPLKEEEEARAAQAKRNSDILVATDSDGEKGASLWSCF